MLNLAVILVSTRAERKGAAIARWFMDIAEQFEGFNAELIDLAEIDLPVFDEAKHPRLAQYEHEHTRAWSERIARADAFVFVTPEYNFGTPPSLSNALVYLHNEWAYKPVGFVSYGGVSGGTRGVQMTKQYVTSLKMMPMAEAVAIPFFMQHLNADTGSFDPGEMQAKAASVMLAELQRWATALQTLRAPAPEPVG